MVADETFRGAGNTLRAGDIQMRKLFKICAYFIGRKDSLSGVS